MGKCLFPPDFEPFQADLDTTRREITAADHGTYLFTFCLNQGQYAVTSRSLKWYLKVLTPSLWTQEKAWQSQISLLSPREYCTHHSHAHLFLHPSDPAAISDTHSCNQASHAAAPLTGVTSYLRSIPKKPPHKSPKNLSLGYHAVHSSSSPVNVCAVF